MVNKMLILLLFDTRAQKNTYADTGIICFTLF